MGQAGTHGIILINPDGVVVGWLAGAIRLFGYEAGEVVGQDVSLLFTPEDLKAAVHSL
jgi:PAS domain S-box-containing protein